MPAAGPMNQAMPGKAGLVASKPVLRQCPLKTGPEAARQVGPASDDWCLGRRGLSDPIWQTRQMTLDSAETTQSGGYCHDQDAT